MAGFKYPFDIQSTLEPWRHELGNSFNDVVAHLADRDRALEDFLGTWRDYTPTLTNMTLGNGTIVARYSRVGNLVSVRFTFTLGSTSAMGTGPKFTLPVLAANAQGHLIGACMATDVNTNIFPGFVQCQDSGASAGMRVENAAGTYVNFADITATVPITWATTHWIDAMLTYEAAS